MSDEREVSRLSLLRKAFRLEVFTVAWNIVEGIVAIAAGAVAGSVALVGFGVDSFIETASGVVVGWRFHREIHAKSDEPVAVLEQRASKIAGALLLCLATYILADAGRRLLGFGPEAEESRLGIVLTVLSLIIMPILAWGKLKTAAALGSKALRADAHETIACSWLSLTTLVGLVLNASFGWSWADPVAACVLVPLIVKEGLEGLRGDTCCD